MIEITRTRITGGNEHTWTVTCERIRWIDHNETDNEKWFLYCDNRHWPYIMQDGDIIDDGTNVWTCMADLQRHVEILNYNSDIMTTLEKL